MSARSAGWIALRLALVVGGVTLAGYIPFKYATEPHALRGLYGFLFPLSPVLAAAGVALGLKPHLAVRAPVWLRTGLAALAVGWVATGLLCIPSLVSMIRRSPGAGLFALSHMLLQHVALSVGVAALALAPQALHRRFGRLVPGAGVVVAAAASRRAVRAAPG